MLLRDFIFQSAFAKNKGFDIMKNRIYSVITGTGSYLPPHKVSNSEFLTNTFYGPDGIKFKNDNQDIITKFEKITNITERRYADDNHVASDLAFFASEDAIKTAGIDKETIDYIIVAHNFGDVKNGTFNVDIMPSLASRVKHKLGIVNPKCIPYDLPFGCPGWLQGVIQADYFIRSGDAKRVLVIGAETLSRVVDKHDRDSMIYSDGAGAIILDAVESEKPIGILSHSMRSDTVSEVNFLWMDASYHPENADTDIFLKMDGKKLYEYALNTVPGVLKEAIEKAGLGLHDIKKVLIHQANSKMNEAILKRTFGLFGVSEVPEGIMPMIISWLGNNSVATIPTLLDLIVKNKIDGQSINKNDFIMFASVGAGMNINAVIYKVA